MQRQNANRIGFIGAILLAVFVMPGCSKNPYSASSTDANEALRKDSEMIVLTSSELRAEFEKLTMDLAQRTPHVIEKLMANYEALCLTNQKSSVSFTELDLASDLPREFHLPGGRILKTTLEKAQPCEIMPESVSSKLILAPDPDRFQLDKENHICKGLLIEGGEVSSVSFTLEEYRAKFKDIPLFLVGGEENIGGSSVAPNSKASLQKGPSSFIQSAAYAACHKIRMKTDHDPWSNEETEVYLWLPNSSKYAVTTSYMFDGGNRYDAANRYVNFPDVNNSSIYTAFNGICFFALDYTNRGWVAIEDDTYSGTHNRLWPWSDPPPPPFPAEFNFAAATDVQKANGAALYNQTRYYGSWWSDPYVNSDDIWQSGAYEEFTLDWNPQPPTEFSHYALNDNDFWMVRNTW